MCFAQNLDWHNFLPANLVDMQIARGSLEVGWNGLDVAPAGCRQQTNIGVMEQIIDIDRAVDTPNGAPQPGLQRKYCLLKPLPAFSYLFVHGGCARVPKDGCWKPYCTKDSDIATPL